METRILHGIQPFNDFFFKSCFFNSFFPIVKYFGGELSPYFFSDLIVYREKEKINRKWIDMEYIPIIDFDELLSDSNINVNYKVLRSNVINEIKASINKGSPVIIWIDCFYQPIRHDTYRKKHLAHTLLIYGYDDFKKSFKIIEHARHDSLTYTTKEASYDDINNSYNGYFEHLNKGMDVIGYYEFSKAESLSETDSLTSLAHFHSLSMDNKEKVRAGLEQLHNFIISYSYQDYEQIDLAKIFLEFLNNIINLKKVEKYRVSLFTEINTDLIESNENIINDWISVRAVVAKYVFSLNYRSELFEGIYKRLCSIYDDEWRIFNIQFNNK